jgi:hypothetical protein
MLILHMMEYSGVQSRYRHTVPPEQTALSTKQIAFATHLILDKALVLLRSYEELYKDKYHLFYEFSLLQVCEVPAMSEESLELARLGLIEDLVRSVEDV